MIQDIAPYKYDNGYRKAPPDRDSYLLCYQGEKVLLKREGGEIFFPTFGEAEVYFDEKLYEDYTYLFEIDNMRFYLAGDLPRGDFKGFTWEDIQDLRRAPAGYQRFAGVTGCQLNRWYDTHKYCGRCGAPLEKDEKERMLRCPRCRHMEYPKICPAVIIAVTHGNRILLSKYAGRAFKKYALLAGFAEIGETIEETVRREVMEEVGLKVKNITYYKSQPWSFTDTLLFGFFAELDGEDEGVTLDEEELALAEWFEREEIPEKDDGVSLTNEMIALFKNG